MTAATEVMVGPPEPSTFDPAAFGSALARLAGGLVLNPVAALGAGARLGGALAITSAEVAARSLGWEGSPNLVPAPGDRRFSDPAWDESPWFLAQRQSYLAWARCLRALVEAGGLDPRAAQKAEFALELVADSLAPTNFLL
ncbi:MAG: hypothetical protein ABIS21_01060, partial [Acidimicrobiales bacterium]